MHGSSPQTASYTLILLYQREITRLALTTKYTYGLKRYWLLAPAAGSLLFVILYVVATWFYPGGSQADKAARGFDWMNNYWCNLLNEEGINGEVNGARPVAFVAMVVLALTMSAFAWIFPVQVGFKRGVRLFLQVCGIGAMVLSMFVFTEWHDWMVNIGCSLGVVGAVGTMVGLWRLNWKLLFWWGIMNLLLVGLNNLMYYYQPWLVALPLVQKFTFLFFLGWVSGVSVKMYKRRLEFQVRGKSQK